MRTPIETLRDAIVQIPGWHWRVASALPFSRRAALTSLAVALVITLSAADWLQFRTATSNSATNDAQPPAEWSESQNVAWKVDLPGRGVSSPIVVGDRVVVTASSGVHQDRLHVLCFDADSGKQLWERQFWATGRTLCHPSSANAAPTPASDGKLIVALYSSNDLACLDVDGNLQWFRGLTYDFPQAANDVGMASSPIIVGDLVIVQLECQGESFAAGVDKVTGETRWRIDRPRENGWCSPVVMRGKDGAADVVLLQSPSKLTAHDPATGKELWAHSVACDGISSAVTADGVVYVPSKGMTALRPSSPDKPDVAWNASTLGPGAASAIVDSGKLILVNRAGVLVCANAADGKVLSRTRLAGEFWGTPALVGNRLYTSSTDGNGQVIEIAADGASAKLIGKNKLDDTIYSSPAVSAGALYLRGDKHLYKIAQP